VTRDALRQRVYDAELATTGGTVLAEPLTWEDVTALFHAVVHHPWWIALGAVPPHLARARSDSARSSSNGHQIRIARGGQDATTVTHELAHHLVTTTGPPGGAPHGEEFCAALVRLMQVVGGVPARRRLHDEMAARKVPVGAWWSVEPPPLAPLADTLARAGPGRLRGAVMLPPVVAGPVTVPE
jgi:hypothetical protein